MKKNRLIVRTLFLLSVMSIMPGLARAGTDIWSGGGGNANLFWHSTANWQAGTLPQVGDQLVFTNAVGLVNSNNFTPAGTIFGGITFASPAGGYSLNGLAITLTNNITDNQVVTPESINLPLIVNSPLSLNLNVTANGILNLNNVISGTGALTNSGAGTVILRGSNTFAGPLVVNAGTVQASQETNLPAAPATPTSGNIVINGGTLQALASFTMNTNHGIAVGPSSGSGQGTISVNDQALIPNQFAALRYQGVIANNGAGTGGLTKLGFGNLVLAGANTYTGTTSNEVGTLTLDFAATTLGAPQNNIISSSSPLVLGGSSAGAGATNFSALVVSNLASTVNGQTFASTHVAVGNAVIRTAPAASGTINLALGALDHDSGGILTLLPPSVFGGLGNITTTTLNNNGILGGWATIGSGGAIAAGWQRATNWACNDGANNIVNYTAYTIYSNPNALMSASMGAANNIYVLASATGFFTNDLNGATSTNDVNSIVFDNTSLGATANNAFFVGSNNVIRLGQFGGILKKDTTAGFCWNLGSTNLSTAGFTNSSANGYPVGSTNQSYAQASSGALTAGGPTYGNPGEIVFITTATGSGSGNNWDIDSQIIDNGPGGTVTVVKAGSGYAKIRNHNTYSGNTYIMGGRVQLSGGDIGTANPDGLGTGQVFVFPGAYLFGTPPITPVINIAGVGTVQELDGAWRLSSGAVTNTVVMFGDSGIGGGSPTSPAILMGPVSGNFNMYLGAQGNVGGTGSGIMLSNQCLWTGDTILVARLGTSGNSMRLFLDENDALPHGFGNGNLSLGVPGIQVKNRVGFDLNGFNQTINGLISGFAGITNVIFNGSNSTTSTLTIGDNDAAGVWGGVIEDSDGTFGASTGQMAITKIGGGVEVFTNANTYTGITTISNGVLQLGQVSGSAFGSIANSSPVNISGGTFDVSLVGNYTIPATQTINVSGGALFISTASSASTPVNFTNGTLKVGSQLNTASTRLTVTTTLSLGGATDFIQAVSLPPIPSFPQIYPIITYGAQTGGASLAAVLPSGYGGFVSNDVTLGGSKTVYLVLTNGPVTPFLTWVGLDSVGNLNSTWDANTIDWTNTATGSPGNHKTFYSDGSLITFDDTGRTNLINITAATFAPNNGPTPAGVTITNGGKNYTFTGVGGINGTNGVTKLGAGTLILDNTGGDSYSGGLNIGIGGTVQLGNHDNGGSLGAPNNAIGNNGTLVIYRTNSVLVVSNQISGSGSLTDLDTNTVQLAGNNSFGGALTVTAGGILQAGNNSALGSTNSSAYITNGGSLDLNGFSLVKTVVVQGGGAANPADGAPDGAIYNSAPSTGTPSVSSVVLLGDTVFGCPTNPANPAVTTMLVTSNRWDIRGTGASLTGAFNITKIGINQVTLSGVAVDPLLGNIDVQNGVLSVETGTTGLGDPTKTLTVESGATLAVYQATNQFNKVIVLNGDGLNFSPNNLGTVNNTSGNNVIAGTAGGITLNNGVEITYRTLAGVSAGGSLMLSNNAISGTGSLTKEDTNTLILAGLDSHSGGTTINDGTLILNGINSNPANTLAENSPQGFPLVPTMLGGNGTNRGPVTLADQFWPGVGGSPSTFGSGDFSFDGSSLDMATFSLGSTTNAGGGVNDLLNVNGAFNPNGTPVTINPVGLLTTVGQYTLARFSSSSSDFGSVSTLLPSRYSFTRTRTGGGGPGLELLSVDATPTVLEWNNAANSGLWDVKISSNWSNEVSLAASDLFYQYDTVVLDDGIITSGGTNVLSIATNAVVQPTALIVDSTTNYIIVGPGSIGGAVTITKKGSSTLRIDANNATMTGTTIISGGSLLVNATNALGSFNTVVVVTNDGALDVGGPNMPANSTNLLGERLVEIAGPGLNSHTGCLINSGTVTEENSMQNVLMTADAAIGNDGPINAAGRFDIGRQAPATLSTGGHAYNLTKVGTNQVSLVAVDVDPALGNIDIQGGELGFEKSTELGDPTKTLTVESGAVLEFYGETNVLNKTIIVNGGALAQGNFPNVYFENGTVSNNILIGPVIITNGIVVIGSASATQNGTFSNAISGPSALTIAGSVHLAGTNTYTGNTTVSNGTLFLLGTGSINNSTNISVRTGATIDVTGRANSQLTLGGQLLTGGGTIAGSLSNAVGSTVAVMGNTNSLGILTVTTNAWLNGTTATRLDAANATNDVLSVGGNVFFGGTLDATNISGTPLAAGMSFKVFKAATYSGAFTLVPANPDNNLALNWDTSSLTVNGTLKVVTSGPGVFTNPTGITSFSLAGANIVATGTNGQSGDGYYLLESTNVGLPLSQWKTVATNVLGANGNYTFIGTNVVTPGGAQQFYILSNTNSNH